MVNASSGRIQKAGVTYNIKTQSKPPYNKVEYRTPGTFTFTVPAGITTLLLTAAGGGGGRGGDCDLSIYPDGSGSIASGGSGGTGQLVTKTVTVSSGSSYNVIVGAGGSSGSSTRVTTKHRNTYAGDGKNGGTSSVGSLIKAAGGGGGTGGSSQCAGGDCYNLYKSEHRVNGRNGKSYSGGAKEGKSGWVIIEYGGDI